MTYKIVENAKNVWIRDNADTMDLSPITDASSVYLANGRSVEQELGEGSMISNIVTMDKPMEKVVEGTYDGAFESCVLKGRTLVNIAPNYFPVTKWWDNTGNNSYFKDTETVNRFKPNTDYLFIFEGLDTITVLTGVSAFFTTNNNSLSAKKIKLRTLSELTSKTFIPHFKSSINGVLSEEEKASVRFMLIEYVEGMENWDIPYFEGMCDVKMPILRNVGKNLIDGTGDYIGLGGGDGAIGSNVLTGDGTLKRYSYIVRCKPNTTYTLTTAGTANRCSLGEYSEYPRIGKVGTKWGNTTTSGTLTITTKPTTIYLVCYSYYYGTAHSQSEMDEIVRGLVVQLEESFTATTHEGYKSNILHTSEEIVLREVGGVCDTYNVLTGEYVQRIGEIVLDGSENEWEDWNENSFVLRGSYFSNAIEHSSPTAPRLKCNNMVAGLGETPRTVRYYKSPTVLWTMVGKNNGETLDQFKQWLSQNPTTIQYILAEPVVTIIEPNTMPFAYENGHIILSSGYEGQSLLPVLEYSTVVGRTGQIQSIAKMTRRHEEKLNMLEQMLVQSILSMDYENTLLALNLEMDEVM